MVCVRVHVCACACACACLCVLEREEGHKTNICIGADQRQDARSHRLPVSTSSVTARLFYPKRKNLDKLLMIRRHSGLLHEGRVAFLMSTEVTFCSQKEIFLFESAFQVTNQMNFGRNGLNRSTVFANKKGTCSIMMGEEI